MRQTLVALVILAAMPIAASAADMPVKAPPVPYVAAPASNWTGLYLGGQIGWGWATNQATQLAATPSTLAGTTEKETKSNGFLGGVYGGYNYQFNQFLVGVDGDYSAADLIGTSSDAANTGNGHISFHHDLVKWVATATGRLGYVNNNWLLFAKGGWAWAEFDGNATNLTAGGAPAAISASSTNRNGWTVGGGVEYAFLAHWSAKLEYDYIKFDTVNFNSTDTSTTTGIITFIPHTATSSMNIVKGGIAYRF
jgi:outer membrane immunogenic protein